MALRSAALAAAAALVACKGGAARVTVDPTQRFQVMTGWEAHGQAGQENPGFARFQDALMRVAVEDAGINRVSLGVRSGMEHRRDYYSETRAGRLTGVAARCARFQVVNDNDDPDVTDTTGFTWTELDNRVETVVLPMQRRLAARGERLVVKVLYIGFIQQCPAEELPNYAHAAPAEYAEFVVAAVTHLKRKYDLVPDLWEVVNEPDNIRAVWSGRLIGEAIVAAGARLAAAGFGGIRFVAPSTTRASNALRYIDAIAGVPGALALVSELSYHRYDRPDAATIRAIGERTAALRARSAMLEHMGSGIEDLEQDILLGNVSAWQQFVLAFPGEDQDNGGHYLLVQRAATDTPTVELSSRVRMMRHYFQYVRAGAQRVGAASDQPWAHPAAFQNADSAFAVVVRTERGGRVVVRGLPAGRYATVWTTADAEGRGEAATLAAGDSLTLTLPAAGAATVYRPR